MQDHINYTQILDEVMQKLIYKVLYKVSKEGLKGNHHLYISFITDSTGVVLNESLKKLYPSEMTIVLQHQFQNLCVQDEYFSVELMFNGVNQYICIPFKSISRFSDPSVNFAVRMHVTSSNQAHKVSDDDNHEIDTDDAMEVEILNIENTPMLSRTKKVNNTLKNELQNDIQKDVVKKEAKVIRFDAFKKRNQKSTPNK